MEETSSSSTASTDDTEGMDYEIPKRKKKPWKRQEPLLAGTALRCTKCEYQTILPQHMRWHEKRHERRAGHICPLCSYSLKHKLDIYLHVKNHHSGCERDRILSETKGVDQVGNDATSSEEDENDSEEWIYDAKGSRKRVAHCGDCDFKSTRQNVENHVKRVHPKSTTALPPRPTTKSAQVLLQCSDCEYSTMRKKEFERHEMNHRNKFAHKCSFCSFSSDALHAVARHAKRYHSNTPNIHQEKVGNSPGKERKEWYYAPNGARIRYWLCRDCDYKSTKRAHLEAHVKALHPLSTTALPPPSRPNNHHCTFCQYKTHSKRSYTEHQLHHRKEYTHRCHLCSYSSDCAATVDRHVKNHHTNQNESAELEASKVLPILRCPQCEYSTRSSGNLRLHEKGHNRDEEFKCNCCNFSSEYEYVIFRHLEHHHQKVKSTNKKVVKRAPSKVKVVETSVDGEKVARDLTRKKDQNNKRLACDEEVAQKRNRNRLEEESALDSTVSSREDDSDDHEMDCSNHISDGAAAMKPVEAQQSIENCDKTVLRCTLCDFSSLLSIQMKAHERGHRRNGEFECSVCSFSSDSKTTIDLHLQDCHTLKERIEQAANGTTRRTVTSNQSAIRKSQVTLDRFFGRASRSSPIKVEVEEESNQQRDDQLLRFNKEKEAKLLDLQSRIQVMKKKVKVAQKELDDASSKERDIRGKMNAIASKKVAVEYDLRAKQCEAIELNIKSLDNEAVHKDVVLAEYSALCLENEMKMLEDELKSLREQETILVEDVEEAEGSLIGANQVLQALMSEWDGQLHK